MTITGVGNQTTITITKVFVNVMVFKTTNIKIKIATGLHTQIRAMYPYACAMAIEHHQTSTLMHKLGKGCCSVLAPAYMHGAERTAVMWRHGTALSLGCTALAKLAGHMSAWSMRECDCIQKPRTRIHVHWQDNSAAIISMIFCSAVVHGLPHQLRAVRDNTQCLSQHARGPSQQTLTDKQINGRHAYMCAKYRF
jgi:hypothetical protein